MIHLDLSNYTPVLSSFVANAQAILDIKALFSSEDLLKPRPPDVYGLRRDFKAPSRYGCLKFIIQLRGPSKT